MALLNKGLEYTLYGASQTVCFVVCLSLYYCIESDTTPTKIKGYGMLLPSLIIYYLVSSIGQMVSNKGNELVEALYGCQWIDKPLWFKKTLLLMMKNASRNLEVKPYGLFKLNNSNFAAVTNAAYSYFNILRSFKS